MGDIKVIQKKCIYCTIPLENDQAIDVCVRCGHGIWGERMFSTIKDNMEKAMEKGDLHQGSVSENSL